MHLKKIVPIVLLTAISLLMQCILPSSVQAQRIHVAANKRFFQQTDGSPFFWLGDTGWLLMVKCNRAEVISYLDDRAKKGFNVIQVMLIHDINVGVNVYGDAALINKDVATPLVTAGNDPNDASAYDFWDHVDFVIAEAGKRGIQMALVPIWGGNIKHVSEIQARKYATFLANRYKYTDNIIWLNGGDIKGSDGMSQWQAIGETLRQIDRNHLITFHPRGRFSSSTWFHDAAWLDFNMFQSGHRSYAQDTSANEVLHYGEDNWRYMKTDYERKPIKPSLDGEPSYEEIPYGLHKATEPYWQDFEIRRYAYWSVLAGAAGFTYGHNSVMQFYMPGDSGISFFPKTNWKDAIHAPGAQQMIHLKNLMLSKPFFDIQPDPVMVLNQGERYQYIAAAKGKNYAFVYTYSGREIQLKLGRFAGKTVKCAWFNPANGEYIAIGKFRNKGNRTFDPPGDEKPGNDWVLVLDRN